MTEPTDVAGIGRWVAEWIGGVRDATRNDTGATEQRIETSVERLGHAVVAAIAKFGTPAVAGEPVAFLVCTEEGDPDMVFLNRHEAQQYLEDHEQPIPLYTTPPAQAAESVLEDAARYRWLRDVGDPTWVPFRIRTGYSAAQVDDAIDAARKQGGAT